MANEKRLTEKHYNGKGYYMLCSGVLRCDELCGNCEELDKVVNRLGEFEDKAENTVDAVEVVHGRWVNAAGGRTICNNCGEYPLYDYFGRQKFSRHCPRCGAKMDKEATQ